MEDHKLTGPGVDQNNISASQQPLPPLQPAQPFQQISLPPTTTYQQDVTTEGQRRINLIWEHTQAFIAIFVAVITLMVAAYIVIFAAAGREIPTIFSFAFGTVIGFYFSRTNHAAIGGVGHKPNQTQEYKGR